MFCSIYMHIYRGFPIAMFAYWRIVLIEDPSLLAFNLHVGRAHVRTV